MGWSDHWSVSPAAAAWGCPVSWPPLRKAVCGRVTLRPSFPQGPPHTVLWAPVVRTLNFLGVQVVSLQLTMGKGRSLSGCQTHLTLRRPRWPMTIMPSPTAGCPSDSPGHRGQDISGERRCLGASHRAFIPGRASRESAGNCGVGRRDSVISPSGAAEFVEVQSITLFTADLWGLLTAPVSLPEDQRSYHGSQTSWTEEPF